VRTRKRTARGRRQDRSGRRKPSRTRFPGPPCSAPAPVR
jgi:hypothetical protein